MPSTLPLWKQFELDVCELYRLMGYRVLHDVRRGGQQIDVLGERTIPGGGAYQVYIDCKYHSGNQRVSNQELQDVASAFHLARLQGGVQACVVVTNTAFTPDAEAVAREYGILLKTHNELMRSLLDFGPYLERVCAEYYRDFGVGDDSWYIHTKARRAKTSNQDLNDVVDSWRKDHVGSPMVVLGGYGTGKSSFCRHYAVRMLETGDHQFPIILHLRNYPHVLTIRSLIRDFLEEDVEAQSPRFPLFWKMYQEGSLLLFLDGFDEMAAKVDSTTLEANLVEIEQFAREGGRLILTCRPEFFVTRRELETAFRPVDDPLTQRMAVYEPIEVELWSPQQVEQYVRKRLASLGTADPRAIEEYVATVRNLPELRDMATRAVHLELIVRLLPHLVGRATPLSRTQLYETYLRQELRRETIENRRLQVLDDEERLKLLFAMAADQLLGGADSLSFEAAARFVQSRLALPRQEVDGVTRDFLNRSFLHRKGDLYQFAHKSLGEYLLAVEVCRRLQAGDSDFILKFRFTEPTAGMALELSGGLPVAVHFLAALGITANRISGTPPPVRRFAMDALRDCALTLRPSRRPDAASARNSILQYLSSLKAFYDLADRGVDDRSDIDVDRVWRQLCQVLANFSVDRD
jgi:hypothetical protein